MSLYGDLPPPSNEGDSTPNKEASPSSSSSATIVKPALPAAWAASVTRFKPMLNRKPAPPKPKPAQRPMPAGFVAQSTVTTPSPSASVPIAGGDSNNINPSAISVAGIDSTSSKTTETTLDDNSWLKARTAQVQRQDNDAQMLTKKQAKRQLSRTQQGPMSLDDEYDIARPNEYEEFKAMFDTERRQRYEEQQHKRSMDRRGLSRRSRSRSRSTLRSGSYSRSRSRSTSYSPSRSRSRSMSRSRSRSRSCSWTPPSHSRPRRESPSRGYPRSPTPPRGVRSQPLHHGHSTSFAPSKSMTSMASGSTRSRSRSRSKSPPLQSRRSRSRSPRRPFHRQRSQSPSARKSDISLGHGRPSSYKAFAPPPSLISDASARPTTPVTTTAAIAKDISGEDAFMRRAQLSQQRATQSTGHPVAFPAHVQQHHRPLQQENRVTFVPTSQSSLSKGSPTSVILLTNMVGPGEVDDSLQEETAAECEKFGPVVRCLIFEVQNGKVPQEEAVRIFVKFGTAVAAEKALRDLDGRFFGGRQVKGQFFDEKRFDALQLAP